MSYESTLQIVRELSERAMLRPARRALRLWDPLSRALAREPKKAVVAYEDVQPIRIGGWSAHQVNPRRLVRKDAAYEKDFMQVAAEKASTATERRPVVIPAGSNHRLHI